MTSDQAVDRAKELLREQLMKHPDEGVRLLAAVSELSDDHPQVQAVAFALLHKDEANG